MLLFRLWRVSHRTSPWQTGLYRGQVFGPSVDIPVIINHSVVADTGARVLIVMEEYSWLYLNR